METTDKPWESPGWTARLRKAQEIARAYRRKARKETTTMDATTTTTRTRSTRNAAARVRPVRWPLDGSGFVEVLSSDNVTWYEVTLDRERNLRCSCQGYLGHRKCYHLRNAAVMLEETFDFETAGQEAFERASRNDPYRLEVRGDLESF